jgi:uncharacterized protein
MPPLDLTNLHVAIIQDLLSPNRAQASGPTEGALQRRREAETVKSKLLHADAERTYAIVLDPGDEAVQCLTQFATEQCLSAARFTGLGAFSDVVLGFFDFKRKDYRRIPLDEQIEVASLIGDVALANGKPRLHAHIVVTKSDGSAWGGHLLEGHVRPTLEVLLVESPAHLRRKHDAETGLPLIAL